MNIMNADDFYYNALLGSQRQSKNALNCLRARLMFFGLNLNYLLVHMLILAM
ncbi:hypothetical protein [Lactobacillus crispatus]|uniref:hypothetical protein n=1 Tax=Lactobacillus crispatus TaxID=47770 RepID=UPI001415169A|nr:hypothetical protein [Lactobacillus crispatus]